MQPAVAAAAAARRNAFLVRFQFSLRSPWQQQVCEAEWNLRRAESSVVAAACGAVAVVLIIASVFSSQG